MFYILITHTAINDKGEDVHGPGHSVRDYFLSKKIPHIFISHPLSVNILRYLSEIVSNIKICYENRQKGTIFIGVDPLNAFSGLLAKRLGFVKSYVFYTPDYTNQRFNNNIMNSIYHFIDFVTAKNANHVWCVSERIAEVRAKQAIDDSKLHVLPNTPSIRVINGIKSSKPDYRQMVIVGNITKTLNYKLVLESMVTLPHFKLKIVGGGGFMDGLKAISAKLKLNNVEFCGPKSHKETIRIMKESGLGLALYSGEYDTNYYGDSMKIREYLACGLPVITTNVTETANVVLAYKAGEVINLNKESLISSIKKILKNPEKYKQNAKMAAKAYDFDKMISSLLSL